MLWVLLYFVFLGGVVGFLTGYGVGDKDSQKQLKSKDEEIKFFKERVEKFKALTGITDEGIAELRQNLLKAKKDEEKAKALRQNLEAQFELLTESPNSRKPALLPEPHSSNKIDNEDD